MKGHNIKPGTFSQFVDATKQALQRYQQGNATADDIAQLGYAAQNGHNHLAQYGNTGYASTYAEQESLLAQVHGVVEDAHNYENDDPFVGWTLYQY